MTLEVAGYRLERVIGKGGVGLVYAAEQLETGLPVAVKLLRTHGERARHEVFSEAQALARLAHPSIVRILDLGTTTATPFAADGETPFLVMERVEGEPLSNYSLTVPGVFGVLEKLLDVLAYAHARGIVHRDIKPDNVLLVRDGDTAKLRLVDFGLAFGVDDAAPGDGKIRGTPSYMAPEQICAEWRNIGPWTDLYALGCVAWQLATGKKPYQGKSRAMTLTMHVRGGRRSFEPTHGFPDEFERWLDRLLAVNPHDRFRRAADAVTELLGMDVQRDGWFRSAEAGESPADSDTVVSDEPPSPSFQYDAIQIPPPVSDDRAAAVVIPDDWRVLERRAEARTTALAHLRLFALREIQLVGRDVERDALWDTLRTVATRTTRIVSSVGGPSGVGKSRLVRWLAERAHEIGAAEVVTVRHDDRDPPGAGLARLVHAILRSEGLEGANFTEHVAERLPRLGFEPDEVERASSVLADVVESVAGSDRPRSPRGSSPEQRLAVLDRLLRGLATQRPLLLWLDDASRAPGTVALLERIVREGDDFPLLAVATLVDGEDERSATTSTSIVDLVLQTRGPSIRLGPLDDDAIRDLVEALIAADATTVERVVEQADGSPMYAIELVNDWVDRGVLVADTNNRLACVDSTQSMPAALGDIWEARVTAGFDAVASSSEQARLALELGAALGQEFSNSEWRAVCERAGVASDEEVFRELMRRELLNASRGGWAFRHDSFRNAIAGEAKRSGRWAGHHIACAQMLADLYPPEAHGVAVRRARHLAEAGELAAALEPLWVGFRQLRVFGEIDECEALLDERIELCDRLGLAAEARDRVVNWIMAASLGRPYAGDGEFDGWLDRVASVSRRHGYVHELAQAARGQANREFRHGNMPEALTLYDEALRALEGCDDPASEMFTRLRRGLTLHRLGRGGEALKAMFDAVDVAVEEGPSFEARAYLEIAATYLLDGRIEDARRIARRAVDLARECGNRRIEAVAAQRVGDVERHAGRFDEARESYRRASELGEFRVGRHRDIPEFKCALIDLVEGESAPHQIEEFLGHSGDAVDAAIELWLATDRDEAASILDAIDGREPGWLEHDIDAAFLIERYRSS